MPGSGEPTGLRSSCIRSRSTRCSTTRGRRTYLIAAGAMHDLIEKTDATAADLQERFGPRIIGLVLAVSDDDRIAGYAQRKAALRQQVARAGDEELTLFAADKLSKLRDCGARPLSIRRTPRRPVGFASCVLAASGTISARWRCSRSAYATRRSCGRLRDELAMVNRERTTLARMR